MVRGSKGSPGRHLLPAPPAITCWLVFLPTVGYLPQRPGTSRNGLPPHAAALVGREGAQDHRGRLS